MSNGTTGTTTGTAASSLPAGGGTSTAGLAPWAAPYITDYLGKSQALAATDYQPYAGPLTAGPSALQTQAFQGIGSLAVPTQFGTATNLAQQVGSSAGNAAYTPVGGSFTQQGVAQSYMNPYLEQALTPQLAELQRQSTINLQPQLAKLTGAGGYGGSREAILRGEAGRNLLDQIAQTTGQAYSSAFDKAQQQYNTEQQRKIQEAQFGAEFGLKGLGQQLAAAQTLGDLGKAEQQAGIMNLDQMLKGGEIQRGIEQQGITADLEEFNRQREFPYKQVQFMRDMMSGLPVGSVANTPSQLSGIAQLISAVGGIDTLLKQTGQGNLADLLNNLFGANLSGG